MSAIDPVTKAFIPKSWYHFTLRSGLGTGTGNRNCNRYWNLNFGVLQPQLQETKSHFWVLEPKPTIGILRQLPLFLLPVMLKYFWPARCLFAQHNFETGMTGHYWLLPQNNWHRGHAHYFHPATQNNCIKCCPLSHYARLEIWSCEKSPLAAAQSPLPEWPAARKNKRSSAYLISEPGAR